MVSKRALGKLVAWSMVVCSAAGIVATQLGALGEGEPKLVLQLSWAALLFSGLDAILIAHEDR